MANVGWAGISGFFGGDPGGNLVDALGGKENIFGTRPDVAPFTAVTLGDETRKSVEGNLANFDLVTTYLDKIAPGFSDILAKGFENTFSELQGHLPQDVKDQVYADTAFKSLMGGFGGTPMAHALTARDLGLTSLNLTQMGNNSAQQWTQLAEQAYSPWSTSTSQQAAVTAANNIGKQGTEQFGFNVAASPDPGYAGVFNLNEKIGSQLMSFGLGAAGGAIAGGGVAGGAGAGYGYNPGTGQYTQQPAGYSQPPTYNVAPAWSGTYYPGLGVSDRRLKRDYFIIGQTEAGINIYEFEYDKPEGCASMRFLGVMADEIANICPEAVIHIQGYAMVDYDKLGMKMEVA